MEYEYSGRIKNERKNKNISQKKLADMIGIDNTTLSRIESGKIDITVNTLFKIANALDVSVDYLLLDFIPNGCDNSEHLIKQIDKLDSEQKKTLTDIIMILTQNNEQWRKTNKINTVSKNNDKSVDYIEIGKRIRSQRLNKQLSQEKLAELAGISASFLGSIERGEEILSIETLFKIANALNTSVTSILINANKDNPSLGLYDVMEEIIYVNNDNGDLLAKILAILIDNIDKW